MEAKRIKLTLGQIASADNTGRPLFMTALAKLRRVPLGKDAYALAKSLRTIEEEFGLYQNAYAEIVKKYGKEISPGAWKVEGEEQNKIAAAEIKELQANEVEIYLDHKIKLPDVESDLSADDCLALEPIIE